MTTKLPAPSQGPDAYTEWKKSLQVIEGYKIRLTSMLKYVSILEIKIEKLELELSERPKFGHKTDGEPKE